jgi:hypothetical protein
MIKEIGSVVEKLFLWFFHKKSPVTLLAWNLELFRFFKIFWLVNLNRSVCCHARRNVMPVNHGITSSARRDHAPRARPLGPLKGDELACWQFTGFNRSETAECWRMPPTVRAGNERTAYNWRGKLLPTRAVRGLCKLAAHRGALPPHAIFSAVVRTGFMYLYIFCCAVYILCSLHFSILLHSVSVVMFARANT